MRLTVLENQKGRVLMPGSLHQCVNVEQIYLTHPLINIKKAALLLYCIHLVQGFGTLNLLNNNKNDNNNSNKQIFSLLLLFKSAFQETQ